MPPPRLRGRVARKPTGWHAEDIKAALRKRFGGLCALSESWGLHHTAISNTLRRPFNSMRVERRIAAALGRSPHELWPDRWRTDGSPLPRSIDMNPKGGVSAVKRQKKAGA
jgi:Ner family transcriptional regulator